MSDGPYVTVQYSRRVNLGNYEHVDISIHSGRIPYGMAAPDLARLINDQAVTALNLVSARVEHELEQVRKAEARRAAQEVL
jgi:hypothetical protein